MHRTVMQLLTNYHRNRQMQDHTSLLLDQAIRTAHRRSSPVHFNKAKVTPLQANQKRHHQQQQQQPLPQSSLLLCKTGAQQASHVHHTASSATNSSQSAAFPKLPTSHSNQGNKHTIQNSHTTAHNAHQPPPLPPRSIRNDPGPCPLPPHGVEQHSLEGSRSGSGSETGSEQSDTMMMQEAMSMLDLASPPPPPADGATKATTVTGRASPKTGRRRRNKFGLTLELVRISGPKRL